MDLILQRTSYEPDGIFGTLSSATKEWLVFTIEHAYDDGTGLFVPKVDAGTYTCVRHPPNRLPYETFMLENVPDFQGEPVTGILIHILNDNEESEGCIGVGKKIGVIKGEKAVLNSKAAFWELMSLQKGCNSFRLQIIS
jgi:hypothetical protein